MVRLMVLLAFATPVLGSEPAKEGGLGDKVRTFAQENLGKKVDDGECAMLAMKALQAAGAKTTADFKVTGEVGDYVWGTLVEKFADAKPGDIIQFRDVKLVTTTVVKQPGGGTRSSTRSQTMTQHTAIVSHGDEDDRGSMTHDGDLVLLSVGKRSLFYFNREHASFEHDWHASNLPAPPAQPGLPARPALLFFHKLRMRLGDQRIEH